MDEKKVCKMCYEIGAVLAVLEDVCGSDIVSTITVFMLSEESQDILIDYGTRWMDEYSKEDEDE